MKNKTGYITGILFAFIFIVSIGLRLWKIDQPIADWHSFRQVDTASVASLFAINGIDLLHPRYHDLSNIQSGKDNPQGWRMVEFPIYQGIAAGAYRVFSGISIDIYLRIITILCSTLTGFLLGIMVLRRTNRVTGLLTFLTYAVLPFSIFYGRVVLPDPMMVFLSIASLFILDTGQKEPSLTQTALSGLFAACAILVKPQAVFLLLPIIVLMFTSGVTLSRIVKIMIWGAIAAIPIYMWRIWILQFPEGIPAFDWLLNKDNIRFKGAWFFWLFADRLGRLILGYWGLIPFGIGLFVLSKKGDMFFRMLLLGSILCLVVIAGGNVQHDYYQILLLPVISIYVGKGLSFLLTQKEKGLSMLGSRAVAIVSFVFLIMFSWYTIRTYYWIRDDIVEAGTLADMLLPKDAKVITAFNGDTTFLYQIRRVGWPQNFEIDKKISMGASYYLTMSSLETDMEAKELSEKYTVLVHTDRYTIIDLTKKK